MRLAEMKMFKAFVVLTIFSLSICVFGQDPGETLISDDFSGQKVPASQFFDRWVNEYVKWIILPEEKDEFDKNVTIQDKLDFIELFWLKRDPVSETFYNEFKEKYYQRLRFIANNYGYLETPGIDTHRGMVYAVLGEPQYEDQNFTIDGSNFRYGDRFSRRGIVWIYGRQEDIKIPAYYQILFMKTGSNKYEIVADYWGQKSTVDAMLDSGFYGRQGYVPHRLESLLKEKRLTLIKNPNTEELIAKIKSGSQFSVADKEATCSLQDSDKSEFWKIAVCKIKYADMIFKVEDGLNIAELEGDVIIKVKENSFRYPFSKTSIKYTDDELKAKYSEELQLRAGIPKDHNDDDYTFLVEIRDTKSGIVYEVKQPESEKK
jgi:GWxTD domain-containing protein